MLQIIQLKILCLLHASGLSLQGGKRLFLLLLLSAHEAAAKALFRSANLLSPAASLMTFRARLRRLFGMVLLTIITATSSAQDNPPVRILAMGDSLTAGYGLVNGEGFTSQLQELLRSQGHNVEIINGGVSGDTTTGGLARLDWALADQPAAVILALGANDGLRAVDPQLTRANLTTLLEKLTAARLPVLLVGMLAPPNLGQQYEQSFNAIYPELAEQFEVLFYPFFLEGVAARPELNQADGIHPNPQGVALIVQRMLPYVEQLLEQVSAQTP